MLSLIGSWLLQLQDEFMSLHQFNHPRSSHTQMRLTQCIIEHTESASNFKQCEDLQRPYNILRCLCIWRKGNFAAFLRISPREGDARKNDGDGTQEFRFISIKCKKQLPWLYFMGKLAWAFSLGLPSLCERVSECESKRLVREYIIRAQCAFTRRERRERFIKGVAGRRVHRPHGCALLGIIQ